MNAAVAKPPKADPEGLRLVFGTNFKAARIAGGLSQVEVAAATKRNQSYVSNIELGKENMTIRLIAELAAIVRTPARDLFDPDLVKQSKKIIAAGERIEVTKIAVKMPKKR